jgi:hypothetical protein
VAYAKISDFTAFMVSIIGGVMVGVPVYRSR